MISEPTKLPRNTTTQFFKTADQDIFLLAALITIMVFPVNNSAPHTTTRRSPRENKQPPINRCAANGRAESLTIRRKNMAPIDIKAPAIIDSMNDCLKLILVFETPSASAFASISAGAS